MKTNSRIIKKRLYRALRKNELVLTSDLIEDHKLKKGTVLLNEAYSHIIPTYKLRENQNFRTVFSFTDDINVARRLIQDYPDTYTKIGYIDIEITDAFTTNNPNVLFAMPVHRLSDWVELMAYSYDTQKDITNLNYSCKNINFINAVVFSRWSVMSLAFSNMEYLVICDNLKPTILDTDNEEAARGVYDLSTRDYLIKDYHKCIDIVNLLRKQLESLKISQVRKDNLRTRLDELKIYYNAQLT